MLWTIIVILLVLWLLGLVGHVAGGFIHILLVSGDCIGSSPHSGSRGLGVRRSALGLERCCLQKRRVNPIRSALPELHPPRRIGGCCKGDRMMLLS
jgi:hypothetical protein